jgi:hypothetical protein
MGSPEKPAAMLVKLGGRLELDCQGSWQRPRKPQGIILQTLVMRKKVRLPQFHPISGRGVFASSRCTPPHRG